MVGTYSDARPLPMFHFLFILLKLWPGLSRIIFFPSQVFVYSITPTSPLETHESAVLNIHSPAQSFIVLGLTHGGLLRDL